jgi:uncharacterized repeat protein (TIGR01451 family)
MKSKTSLLLAMALPAATWAQVVSFVPERFGVIDITPNNLSGESIQNTAPSLGVGTAANYQKFVIRADNTTLFGLPTNNYYTTASSSSLGLLWSGPDYPSADFGGTVDWSSGGTCYAAVFLVPDALSVLTSSDPTAGVPFSPIPAATYVPNKPFWGPGPIEPSIKVVNVTNVDHIFVGFNDTSQYLGPTASVHYSLDGGTTWNTTLIEKTTPGGAWDSPAVRLAISSDGKTVYSLFQRVGTPFLNKDFTGDVVLVRDDAYGGSDFTALGNGTIVAHNIVIPWQTTLGAQQLPGDDCDVAIDPAHPYRIYVAYTEVVGGNMPVLRVQSSANSGASFSLTYSINNASLPALAVASDGTVGLLYLLKNGNNLEVHFLKAFFGNFATTEERVLAQFPNNNPVAINASPAWMSYLGNSFSLKAVNFNFFGAFCASGDPQPANFPNGVFYERDVKVGSTVMKNFWLNAPGTLVALSGQNVSPSIDPFFFYDIASSLKYFNVRYRPQIFHDTGDPLSGIDHLVWPALPANEPQLQLFRSSTLGANAAWNLDMGNALLSNGQFESPFLSSQPQAFFRLQQNVAGGQFKVFAAAGQHGLLDPSGILTLPGTANLQVVATAVSDYRVAQWYLDGATVQSGGSTLTLSNIITEHTLAVSFAPSNDLAVTLADLPSIPGPTLTFGTNVYQINIQNRGLNPLTSVIMQDPLPGTVGFISATTSQGIINSGPNITAEIGTLDPGASAVVEITFTPLAAGPITNTVNVACVQFEPDLSNNTATDMTTALDPVTITNQPASQTVPAGGRAVFTVGVSGTPPFTYQWLFNGNSIPGATDPTLVLSSVSPAQSGPYSVAVSQTVGGATGSVQARSDAAVLTVGP